MNHKNYGKAGRKVIFEYLLFGFSIGRIMNDTSRGKLKIKNYKSNSSNFKYLRLFKTISQFQPLYLKKNSSLSNFTLSTLQITIDNRLLNRYYLIFIATTPLVLFLNSLPSLFQPTLCKFVV